VYQVDSGSEAGSYLRLIDFVYQVDVFYGIYPCLSFPFFFFFTI